MSTSEPGDRRTTHRGPGRTAAASRRVVLLSGAAIAGGSGFAVMRAWEPAPDTSGTGSGSYGPDANSGTEVAFSELPSGGGVVLPAARVVVTRDDTDEVHAFSAVCTHQGCLVSAVSNGTISCACHGSAFDAATGAVVSGPATAPLPVVPATVEGGVVVVGEGPR